MSKPSKLKDSKRISGEVDLLLDSGFTPDAIIRYLKRIYDLDVSRATIYRYKKEHYKPEPLRRAVKVKLFKDCGRFIDVVETKVGIVAIFMDRISKTLEKEKDIGLPLKITSEMMMDLNSVTNELYEIYQDRGLLSVRDEKISIDATLNENNESKNSLEVLTNNLSAEEKLKFALGIKDKVKEFTGGADEGKESWTQYTDDRN